MAKGVFKPIKLPHTAGAAVQHSLRAFLQYRYWLMLESQSFNPRDYGWIFTGAFEPLGSTEPIAPSSILKFIYCNCQITATENSCENNRCSSKRFGLKCISDCRNRHGLNCSNSIAKEVNEDGVDEDDNEQEI